MMTQQWERENDMHSRREKMRDDSKAEVGSMLTLAGLKPQRMWELANRYWPLAPNYDEVRHPWWLAQTSIGLIEIGRRKRVLSISWEATDVRAVVTEDDVTKENYMVHAWSSGKAVEYLTRLREEAEKCTTKAETRSNPT
jgi:hypothetical protein